MTYNSLEDIDELTKDIYKCFNGLIFVDHHSNDGTKELLESRRGDGEIISLPWTNNHSWSMNAFLNSDKMQPNDWFVLLDTSERMDVDFAHSLKGFIREFEKRNIQSVYHYSKLVIAKYNSDLVFFGSPHWGLHGTRDHKIKLEDCSKQVYIYSVRGDKRPKDHFVNHFVKYYLYKNSNHLLLGRENAYDEFRVHEEIRNKFRLHCFNDLNIYPLNTTTLLHYLKNNELKYETKWFLNFEPILNDFYRYRVLNHSLDDILADHKQIPRKLFKI